MTLSWSASEGATGYRVRGGVSRKRLMIVAQNIEGTRFVDTSPRNDRVVYYTVTALNAFGEGEPTQAVRVRPSEAILDWLPAGSSVERLASPLRFAEGPLWNPAEGGFLLFSDLNADRIHRWDLTNGLCRYFANVQLNSLGLDHRACPRSQTSIKPNLR